MMEYTRYAIREAVNGDLEKEIHGMMDANGFIDIVKESETYLKA